MQPRNGPRVPPPPEPDFERVGDTHVIAVPRPGDDRLEPARPEQPAATEPEYVLYGRYGYIPRAQVPRD
jgi:hypothetical protein